MPTDDFLSLYGGLASRDLLIAEDSYPKMVIVEFRARNAFSAFNALVTGSTVLIVDAVGDSCRSGVEMISLE